MSEGDLASQGASSGHTGELLSCVPCRNRKLKCDKAKPVCARCCKANIECVFPESRKKPAFRRKNVRELEARLVQVEALLKEVGEKKASEGTAAAGQHVGTTKSEPGEVPVTEDVLFRGIDVTEPDLPFTGFSENDTPFFEPDDPSVFAAESSSGRPMNDTFNGELIDLGGIFESLPPKEFMEDLNRIFFERQQHIIPIIHPARYSQAFYSAPHMKPPLCLQYAIWALASAIHPKYEAYRDVFYRRARQYAESDELKGYGEHFITVAHAQAWAIIGTYEARALMFTRAAMSCSRAVRLVQMMGLHRLDCPSGEVIPTLLPPRDWAELEERRRTFWGIFCIDSHASISTGWPHLIDASEITTHLPSTESAFFSGEEEETCSIYDAFKGRPYSSFAGNVLVCHLFNQILKHVYHTRQDDHAENYEYGEFWKRHREIDNILSGAFMFLPESSRLPENFRNPTAVHTNLNLHASVICLYHAAIDKIDTYKLPESAKNACQARLRTSAQEIINIIKLTSHVNSSPKTPLVALSLYCAASVYIYLCKDTQTPTNVDNLDFVISAMEAIGRCHTITRAFLRQVILDVERNDLQSLIQLPRIDRLSRDFANHVSPNIPLLARSRISRHSQVQPPLPGRLPLGNPVGKVIREDYGYRDLGWTGGVRDYDDPLRRSNSSNSIGNKRKRTTPADSDSSLKTPDPLWAMNSIQDLSATPSSTSSHQDGAHAATPTQTFSSTGIAAQQQMNIPHRVGSPLIDQRTAKPSSVPPPQSGKHVGVCFNRGILGTMGPAPFTTAGHGQSQTKTTKGGMGDWYLASMCMRARFEDNEALYNDIEINARGDMSPFGFVADETTTIDWDGLGANIGVGSVEGATANSAPGDASRARDDGFGGSMDEEGAGIRGRWL
ncbi:fungal-specific transcription factor domain-containing protein [Biscogniauxia marginata]|nr:fungal-specific transcription factor domain-containing protein [Biscogniauxia marginata]